MSTRCLIAIQHNDHTFESIYCHNDGYDDGHGVGPTLRQYFHTPELAHELIALGNVSYIQESNAYAYHRDKGESYKRNRALISHNKPTLLQLAKHCDAHYVYVFTNARWETVKLRKFT